MLKGIMLSTNGNAGRVMLDGLADYQRIVGGYIDAVDFSLLDMPVTMYFNEEGKGYPEGCPLNLVATKLVSGRLQQGDWIGGDVVLIGIPDADGETQSLTDQQITLLLAMIKQLGADR